MPHTPSAPAVRLAAVAVLAAVTTAVSFAAPASAHVTVQVSSTSAGAEVVVRMVVPHGCAGSATTEVAVRVPEGVTGLRAEDTQRWAAEVVGDEVTFRTDSPLSDGLTDTVAFAVSLPDDVGAELAFPVVQRCEEGEAAWTEVAEDEAARKDLDMPAPVIVVTADDGSMPQAASLGEPAPGPLMTYGAPGLLALACLASGAVLLLRRRRA